MTFIWSRRIRPDSAEMIEGETNKLTFNLTPMAGASTITGTPTVACSDLTITGTAINSKTVTAFVSGGTAGKDYIVTLTAVLSSGETKVGAIKLEWKAAGYDSRTAAGCLN